MCLLVNSIPLKMLSTLLVYIQNMIDGKIVMMSNEECSRLEDSSSLNIVEFIEKRCFHKQMTQDDIGDILDSKKYSNEEKLKKIKKYLEIGADEK